MDLESTLALAHDQPDVLAFLQANDGTLERDDTEPGVYWTTMRPRATPSERYYVCIRWMIYPHAAPSVSSPPRWVGRSWRRARGLCCLAIAPETSTSASPSPLRGSSRIQSGEPAAKHGSRRATPSYG